MARIVISVSEIRKNLVKFGKNISLISKSNLYGFGDELIRYIDDLVDSYVVSTDHEYINIRKFTSSKVIILYSVSKNNVNYAKRVCNNLENGCFSSFDYIRIDNWLGLHGISTKSISKISK